jgi:uncharacterized protein (TIGR02266 family)
MGKKIVLADDVELFLSLEKTFFSREEFDLMTARDGREALQLIMTKEPDLVFMDLYMPKMNGDECCRFLKEDDRYRHIPIILVIHGGREEELERCRTALCDAIVLKPINRNDFVAMARKFLNVQERTETRYLTRLRIQHGTDARQLLTNYTVDLSTGGVFIETPQPLPVNAPLIVEFILPGSEKAVKCNARVAWVNPPEFPRKANFPSGMGLQFLDPTVAGMDAIREYVKQEKLAPMW